MLNIKFIPIENEKEIHEFLTKYPDSNSLYYTYHQSNYACLVDNNVKQKISYISSSHDLEYEIKQELNHNGKATLDIPIELIGILEQVGRDWNSATYVQNKKRILIFIIN
jgi:hypothetical protein